MSRVLLNQRKNNVRYFCYKFLQEICLCFLISLDKRYDMCKCRNVGFLPLYLFIIVLLLQVGVFNDSNLRGC